jgi:heme iron utilization protein
MLDFNLNEFKITYSKATFGFAKAYFMKGKNMNELIAKTGDTPHHKAK